MHSSERDKTLTVEEAAEYLRVDPVTVERELRRGRLPGNRVGRAWRLSGDVLADYIRNGDPTAAMFEASGKLEMDEVDEALRILLRSVVADRLVPPALRLDLLKRVGVLAEAEETGSAQRARDAAFGADDPRWQEERFGTISRMIVHVNGVWNNQVVTPFVKSLARRNKSGRGRGE